MFVSHAIYWIIWQVTLYDRLKNRRDELDSILLPCDTRRYFVSAGAPALRPTFYLCFGGFSLFFPVSLFSSPWFNCPGWTDIHSYHCSNLSLLRPPILPSYCPASPPPGPWFSPLYLSPNPHLLSLGWWTQIDEKHSGVRVRSRFSHSTSVGTWMCHSTFLASIISSLKWGILASFPQISHLAKVPCDGIPKPSNPSYVSHFSPFNFSVSADLKVILLHTMIPYLDQLASFLICKSHYYKFISVYSNELYISKGKVHTPEKYFNYKDNNSMSFNSICSSSLKVCVISY